LSAYMEILNTVSWKFLSSLLVVDGGMHPLHDSVDSGPSHCKGVMLDDNVNIEALRFMKAEWSFNQKRIYPA